MDLGIAGKRAVVIGGSSGLGYAVSKRLATEGAHLLIFARNEKRLAECRKNLEEAYGVEVQVCAGDISSEADIKRLAQQCTDAGGIEILVLNTPRPPSPMREFLDEQDQNRWDIAYEQQLHGALLVMRIVTPLLLGRGWGRIVAITSASVKQPMPRHAVSTVFRAGVQAALKHLAMELAHQGVTVNSVAPATVITPTFAVHHNLEQRILATPLRRAGSPEELSATVAFLASRDAGFITGESIQIDGGATLSLC